MLMMHAFGTGTHSDQAIGVASKTFTTGLSGIWYQWLWLFCTPFYWLMAPVLRRFRALTIADVFEARYNLSVAILYAIMGMSTLIVIMGLMLKGSGTVVATCLGEGVSTNTVIAIMTILFMTYGMVGGLSAAIVTDYIQGILTIIFSFLLLPFIMEAVGGMSGLRVAIEDPHMFSLVAPEGIGIFYPEFARAWYNLSLVYAQQNRLDAAITAIESAERLEPEAPDHPFVKATLFYRQGKLDEAILSAEKALDIDPNFTPARSMLNTLSTQSP